MSSTTASDEALLTPADVRRRVDEYNALEREIAERSTQRDEIGEWLEKLTSLLGEERIRSIVGDLPHRRSAPKTVAAKGERPTFTGFIEDYVREQGRGVDYRELREAVMNSPMRATMERTDKTFHSSIGKLVERNRLVKHNQRLYSQEAVEEHRRKVAAGEVEDTPPENASGRVSPMSEAISEFVARRTEGVRSREIVAHVGSIDDFAAIVERNTTNVYNQLSRMVRQGRLRKEGSTYFPVDGDDENSGTP